MTVQDVSREPVADPGDGKSGGRPPWVLLVAVIAVAGLIGGALWWSNRPPAIEDPAVAARAMATAWTETGLAAVTWATPPGPDQAGADDDATPARTIPPAPTDDQVAALLGDLGPDTLLDGLVTADATVASVTPPDEADPLTATATFDVVWQLPRDRTWEVTSTATLVRHPDEITWAPIWDASAVHADLLAGDTLEVRRSPAERGRILDAAGNVVVGPQRVTEIGLHPRRIEDLDEVVTAIVGVMQDELGVTLDPDDIRADVAAADPEHFVPVITLRNEDYQRVEPAVFPLIGTSFRDGERFLAPTADFARYTLGSVGPVTAEQLDAEPERWEPGDLAGRSGIQEDQDAVLAGTTGWSIVAVREDAPDPTLHDVAPVPGRDVTITLDTRLQQAAEAALADTGHASAMAVVRPSDGHVLALANSQEATFDIARLGQLPPGSVFKVITTTALMQDGVTADTTVGCPNTIEAGGRTISNAGGLALGDTVFARVFANSCNTSFIDLSRTLAPTALRDAAAQLGVGTPWEAGVAAFPGEVPETEDALDLALASFGQGRTLVNPLDMATMMASVAAGATVTPVVVPAAVGGDQTGTDDPTGDDPTGDDPTGADSTSANGSVPLPAEVAAALQDLTRLVVTDGTGGAMRDAPGPSVHGKTGTAEFTNAEGQLAKHVWFAGYQDDLAFAVVVTDTPEGSGGGTAAPLARTFLESIHAD